MAAEMCPEAERERALVPDLGDDVEVVQADDLFCEGATLVGNTCWQHLLSRQSARWGRGACCDSNLPPPLHITIGMAADGTRSPLRANTPTWFVHAAAPQAKAFVFGRMAAEAQGKGSVPLTHVSFTQQSFIPSLKPGMVLAVEPC